MRYVFYLDEEDDAELIAFIEKTIANIKHQSGITRRSAALRAMMYKFFNLAKAMQESKSLRRSVSRALNNAESQII